MIRTRPTWMAKGFDNLEINWNPRYSLSWHRSCNWWSPWGRDVAYVSVEWFVEGWLNNIWVSWDFIVRQTLSGIRTKFFVLHLNQLWVFVRLPCTFHIYHCSWSCASFFSQKKLPPYNINPWPCGFNCYAQPSLVNFKPCNLPRS